MGAAADWVVNVQQDPPFPCKASPPSPRLTPQDPYLLSKVVCGWLRGCPGVCVLPGLQAEELVQHPAHQCDDVLVSQLEAQPQQLLEGLHTLSSKQGGLVLKAACNHLPPGY
jgi:hypothetical protein